MAEHSSRRPFTATIAVRRVEFHPSSDSSKKKARPLRILPANSTSRSPMDCITIAGNCASAIILLLKDQLVILAASAKRTDELEHEQMRHLLTKQRMWSMPRNLCGVVLLTTRSHFRWNSKTRSLQARGLNAMSTDCKKTAIMMTVASLRSTERKGNPILH
jgi:hypothetical protein